MNKKQALLNDEMTQWSEHLNQDEMFIMEYLISFDRKSTQEWSDEDLWNFN